MQISNKKRIFINFKRGIQIIIDFFKGKDYIKTVSTKNNNRFRNIFKKILDS